MRRLLALAALVASALVLTTPAHAGGPTSVLVTEPGAGQATALYYGDTGYAELERLTTTGVERLDGEPTDLGARSVNLTWLAHDVHPWRTQQLYVEAAGGPVLATSDPESGRTDWARVTEGKAVAHLVDQLLRPGVEPDLAAVAAPEPVVTERVVTETAWWSLAGWRWLLLGLLVGAGAALLVVRRHEPRRELDLDPGAEVLAR